LIYSIALLDYDRFITGKGPFPSLKLKISDRKFRLSDRNLAGDLKETIISDRIFELSVRNFEFPYLIVSSLSNVNFFLRRENRSNLTGNRTHKKRPRPQKVSKKKLPGIQNSKHLQTLLKKSPRCGIIVY